MNDVGYTCQITAGFRAVELSHNPQPVISDPLAIHLAVQAYQTAYNDWQKLVEAQGPGKSLRVPARNRIMDDLLLRALQSLAAEGERQAVQVVNVGCGMDTKPWRLQLPCADVHWFDVDQPAVMKLKQQLLQQAGAALQPQPDTDSSTDAGSQQGHSNTATSGPPQCVSGEAVQQQDQPHQQRSFPLRIKDWHPVAADLAEVPLADCLKISGFRSNCCTIWLAEALLYYLPLDTACELLSTMRQLSGPGSQLIATCADKELQLAHQALPQDHYFAASKVTWHFNMDELLQDNRLHSCGWQVAMQPQTTAELTLEWYGKDTYVALYGGAELCFTALMV